MSATVRPLPLAAAQSGLPTVSTHLIFWSTWHYPSILCSGQHDIIHLSYILVNMALSTYLIFWSTWHYPPTLKFGYHIYFQDYFQVLAKLQLQNLAKTDPIGSVTKHKLKSVLSQKIFKVVRESEVRRCFVLHENFSHFYIQLVG